MNDLRNLEDPTLDDIEKNIKFINKANECMQNTIEVFKEKLDYEKIKKTINL